MTTSKDFDFMDKNYAKEQKCFDDVVVTGKDWQGKKASTTWPFETSHEWWMYELWLSKVKDPETDTPSTLSRT